MNKIVKRIIIGLLIILLTLGAFITITKAMGTYTNLDRNVIIGATESEYGTLKSYTLSTGKIVSVVENTAWYSNCFPILEQPNVWCVENGLNIGNTDSPLVEYIVSEEYTVSDPILAYILAHGPSMGTLEDYHGADSAQNALWTYLSSSNDKGEKGSDGKTDKERILSNISCSAGDVTLGETILANANAYSTTLATKVQPTITTSIEGNILKITVSGTFERFTLKVGDMTAESYTKGESDNKIIDINISELVNEEGKVSITVTPEINQYTVKYRILKNDSNQRILVATYVNEGPVLMDNCKKTTEVQINTDVSLQKYVTRVNGNKLNDNNSSIKNRVNTKTVENDDERVKDAIKKDTTASNDYKKSNIVQIEAGDTVTYRVYIYNNSTVNATEVLVKDRVPYYLNESGEVVTCATIESIYRDGNSEDTKSEWQEDRKTDGSWNNDNTYKYTITNLAAGATTYFDITLKFNSYIENTLTNTAWISSTKPTNSANYRTVDRDYVQMKKYSVSLEKFVSYVNGEEIEDRSGKRLNEELIQENENISTVESRENLETYKYKTPVKVETGDEVTFTIRLKNTDEKTAVKITQIYDSFRFEDNGIQLKYISSSYGADDNTKEIEINTNYYDDSNLLNRYLITFKNAKLLQPGESIDVKVKFEVIIPQNLLSTVQILQNKAKIVSLENEKGISINDSDGEENNADMDFLKTKTYAVSLEKYVSGVYQFDDRYDFNRDTQLNDKDAKLIQQYVSDLMQNPNTKPSKQISDYGDINNDGKISTSDAIELGKLTYQNIEITSANRKGVAEHSYDNNSNTRNDWKLNNVVTVKNGDIVAYTIKVTNNSTDASVYVSKIVDDLPTGVIYNSGNTLYTAGEEILLIDLENELLGPGESDSIIITVEVTEPNISLNVLENRARITELKNKNGDLIEDTTQNDNEDADYIKLNYEPTPPPTTPTPTPTPSTPTPSTPTPSTPTPSTPTPSTPTPSTPTPSTPTPSTPTPSTPTPSTPTPSIPTPTPTPDTPEDPVPNSAIISGFVWNDKLVKDKAEDRYDGIFNKDTDKKLANIKVYLYRVGVSEPIATKYTDDSGYYSFTDSDIDKTVITNSWEQYIKAPLNEDNNRWDTEKGYYSYYIVFEYDGITYTSTVLDDEGNHLGVSNDNYNDSNAKEDNSNGKTGLTTRNEFNSGFTTKNVSYTTENKKDYIPQSNHIYDANTMSMQSSTNLIKIGDVTEEQLKHINLGLRGRDVFDLELTSDVHKVKVTINGQLGVYQHNKITLRQGDLNAASISNEDMANKEYELSNTYDDSQQQKIRQSDFNETNGISNIEVTYKITVHNASQTAGIATILTDYYDKCYSEPKNAKLEMSINNNEVKTSDKVSIEKIDTSNGLYNKLDLVLTDAVEEILGDSMLEQSQSYSVYVTFTMDVNTLKDKFKDSQTLNYPTYNMVEIAEYKTSAAEGQSEYTRGLIDKDSAPGSVNKEQVRLTTTEKQSTPTINGSPTTVEYYFNKKLNANKDNSDYLKILKYEDDTYATPTLYFVSDTSLRSIEGTVFEDYTTKNSNLIKSGNGIKNGEEPTIKGITVKLLDKDNKVVSEDTTDANGYYKLEGFLPGNYTIRYYYGDTEATFLKQSPNVKSYNGEDFQATNNKYDVDGIDVQKLSTRNNYWYLDNETVGISTATDIESRRNEVSANVISFTTEQMIGLNNARKGKSLDESNVEFKNTEGENIGIIGATQMYANTKSILLNVEKTDTPDQSAEFGTYIVSNMNFGIAEVPVTKIDLQKSVQAFTITDSTGQNIIASIGKNSEGKWENEQNVLPTDTSLDVSVEDEKLQGARLQVKYAIKSNIDIEINYDETSGVQNPPIKTLVDIIDNNLSYNPDLDNNIMYWTVMNESLSESSIENIQNYNTIVKANGTTIESLNNGGTVYITLEKVLSSTESTLEEIITSTVDIYVYNNIVEITELDYTNVALDRIRTEDGFIILPGVRNDMATAEIITIHPPTGDSSINTMYYIIAAVSLVILAIGTFVIKKFVLNNQK